jgi:hypothetical protein
MSNSPIYHYVYRITNTIENKHYYGKRKSNISPFLDLGRKYFSSSSDKEFMKDQKENPQNYKYKIIWVTDDPIRATNLEIKLHDRFDVAINENFYNKAKQTSTKFDTTGISGENHILIDVYNYYTGEIIAERVISNKWAKDNGYTSSHLSNTIIACGSKMHNSEITSPYYNPCHHKGVYAVIHGVDGRNKFNKEHINNTRKSKKGHNNVNSIAIDVYDYFENRLIEENVVAVEWCAVHGCTDSELLKTIIGDPHKPHLSNRENPKYNPCHHKGFYAVLCGGEMKNFSKDHIEDTKYGYKGHKKSNAIPIDIYCYKTNNLIAANVIANDWCKDKPFTGSNILGTINADPLKPHCTKLNSENVNYCHHNGIYAVLHGCEPKNFSKEHIEHAFRGYSGHNNPRARPIDVYEYHTNMLIAENVISNVWCKENGYAVSMLNRTIKADINKPHNSTLHSPKYNLCHTKGVYAVYHGEGTKNFIKERNL